MSHEIWLRPLCDWWGSGGIAAAKQGASYGVRVAIAVRMGVTKKDFDATIGIHPSVAEDFFTLR